MMRRLFWRIFAAFWLATVVVLVAFAWVTTSNFETEKIPGLGITRLQAAMDDLLSRASGELRRGGEDDAREWLQATAGFGSIGIYVFNPEGKEMLGRNPAPAIRDAAAQVAAEAAQTPADVRPGTLDAERIRVFAFRRACNFTRGGRTGKHSLVLDCDDVLGVARRPADEPPGFAIRMHAG